MPRTALVTGATGYLGRHLCRALCEQGWTTHVLVRAESPGTASLAAVPIVAHAYDGGTPSVMAAVAAASPQVVFHLASLFVPQHTSEQVAELVQTNVLLGTQVAEAMATHDCMRLVNVGTGWQHFEQAAYNPVNLYASTKQAFEDILEYYVQARSLRVITLKLFDTYGPHDPRPKLMNLLLQAADQRTTLDLSPGEQQLDLVYVDDAVAAFLLAAERLMNGNVDGHERYVVSSGHTVSLRELVAVVAQIAEKSIPVQWGARPYRPREVMVPWQGGRRLPGWQCRVSLAEGVRRIVAARRR